eukprot:3358696-Pyramimonas_sp.AAC.1
MSMSFTPEDHLYELACLGQAYRVGSLSLTSSGTPRASSSAVDQKRTHSSPAMHFLNTSSALAAPGKRQLIPTMAVARPFTASPC